MDGMRYPVLIHLHGTLTANAKGVFRLPAGMTLVEVSACGSNANDATLQLGTLADADGILVAKAIGDASVPAVWERGDFDGALVAAGQCGHFAKGTIISWLLDFDGGGGAPAEDVDVLLTFLEG